jgi:1-deoxy-D-xylulose 5-phosphate reductoisomerase
MIEKFLQKKCGFLYIGFGIIKAYNKFCDVKIRSIKDVFEVDKEVRRFVRYL